MKYRKKPIVIEATQWRRNGDHPNDGCVLIPDTSHVSVGSDGMSMAGFRSEGKVVRYFRRPDVAGELPCKHCGIIMHQHGWIDTLEGGHIVCPGDFIITGIKGEMYPCKPDVFAATYEPLESSPAPA